MNLKVIQKRTIVTAVVMIIKHGKDEVIRMDKLYAIKWKRENHPIIKENASGLVLNNEDVDKLNEPLTFDTKEQAEDEIVNLKKTASWSISFEVVPYEV